MEVKQELDDFFIEDQKIKVEEHIFPYEVIEWNNQKYYNQTSQVIKHELHLIKQEDFRDLKPDETCVDAGSSANVRLDMKQPKRSKRINLGTSTKWNGFLKRWVLPGGILICKSCGRLYTKNFEFYHHVFRHFVNKTRLYASHSPINSMKKTMNVELKYRRINILSIKAQLNNKLRMETLQDSSHVDDNTEKTGLRFEINKYRSYPPKPASKCDICLKSINGSLNRHIRCHTGEKPFKCHVCSKTFRENFALNNHMRSHTGEKPYKCEICSSSFGQKSSLKRHMISHTDEKPFECEICSKTFKEKGSLVIHKRRHTGEGPIKCEICSKPFTFKCRLDDHMLRHTGVKSYNCKICSKFFVRKNALNAHMRLHDDDKRVKCDFCPRSFTHRIALNKHMCSHINFCVKGLYRMEPHEAWWHFHLQVLWTFVH